LVGGKGLRFSDRWIWDFWIAHAGEDFHIFYLQTPRSIGDPELRHWNVSIGHAVSTDLENWEVLPDALAPGPAGAWDDYTTWTGSIVNHEGRWYLLYTGTSRAENGRIQRIGLATSDDLVVWTRHDESPVIEADPRWYETLDLEVWPHQAWRDPWVFHDPKEDAFHAYITARARTGDPSARAVIGHACSSNLVDWEILPPVTEPMGFGEMEVPQVTRLNGRFCMLFSSERSMQAPLRQATGAGTGTYYLTAPSPEGPFTVSGLGVLDADPLGSSYAGKLIDGEGELRFLSWERTTPDGSFVGAIGSPRRVFIHPNGTLTLGPANDIAR
jgi:beta-fructofuranosidase